MEEGVRAVFYKHAVLHAFNSQQEGRPVYIDQDYVRIVVAGVDKDIVERKATEQDKERFAAEWDRYQRGLEQAKSGTPLEMWPRMTPAMVATLKGLHICTVEDMATLSDLGCQKVGMGAYDLRSAAQKYLNSAAQTASHQAFEKLEEENTNLKSELATLREMVEKMAAEKDEPKRRKKEPA